MSSRILVLLSLVAFFALTLAKGNETLVAKLIETPSNGAPGPLLWFRTDPRTNCAPNGDPYAVRLSDDLSARAPDPWGQQDSAFGPADNEYPKGASIKGTGNSSLMSSDEGTVLMFMKAPERGIILTKGGYKSAFDLRTSEKLSIVRKRGAVDVCPLTPGEWYLIVLRWKKQAEEFTLDWSVGNLASGADLDHGTTTVDFVGILASEIELGGRTMRGSDKNYACTGGFFNNFAIYNTRLSDSYIEALYAAAKQGLK